MKNRRAISRETFERDYAKNKSLLEDRRDQLIVVYCSNIDCEDSDMVADALVRLAYPHMQMFKGGWDEWEAAGLPQEGEKP
jgi:rhodanese-related sulfurtransferase